MLKLSRIRTLVAAAAAVGGLTAAAPAPAAQKHITIDQLYCISLGHGRLECQYSVSGAAGPVVYTWSPQPTVGGGDGGFAIVPCNPYRYRTVTLSVTDGITSDTQSGQFWCGDAV